MAFERVAGIDELAVGHALFAELSEPVCVVRLTDDVVKAVHDTCSHQEYPLHEGWIEDNAVECALHGSMFDLDSGKPEALPAVQAIPVYAAKIEDSGIWVDVAQQLNDAPVPRH